MQIAMASGKGGTGKTTLATNLARVAADDGRRVVYMDCDVEEPNGHIFLPPENTVECSIDKRVPQVDVDRCLQRGDCEDICQYNAIVCVGGPPIVFPDLCHACGGCVLVCPSRALQEVTRSIGRLRMGDSGGIGFLDGALDIGQHMGPPAIRAVKRAAPEADLLIIDAPPGTSCPAVEAVRGSDFVVLVTEPTPFGLNDLKLAVEMVRTLKLAVGVVVNRAGVDGQSLRTYCRLARVPIIGELPDDRAVAEAYSRGQLASRVVRGYRQRIETLLQDVLSIVESS